MKAYTYILGLIGITTAPAMLFAQTYSSNGRDFAGVVGIVLTTITYIVPLLTAVALLVFLWGLARFILNAGSEDKVSEGKQLMIWGVIALFVLVSVWGIISLFHSDLFGGTFSFPPRLPISK